MPIGRTMGLAAVTLALLSGCGEAGSEASEEKSVSKSLIGIADLPLGARMEKELPEPCGPLPILEGRGAKVAKTDAMGFGEVIVKEAIGVFPDTSTAETAYAGLTESERTKCIGDSLEPYYPTNVIKTLPPTSLDLAEESSATQYQLFDDSDSLKAVLDAASLRSGPCVLTLLFLRRGNAMSDQSVPELSETAVGLLPSSCE